MVSSASCGGLDQVDRLSHKQPTRKELSSFFVLYFPFRRGEPLSTGFLGSPGEADADGSDSKTLRNTCDIFQGSSGEASGTCGQLLETRTPPMRDRPPVVGTSEVHVPNGGVVDQKRFNANVNVQRIGSN